MFELQPMSQYKTPNGKVFSLLVDSIFTILTHWALQKLNISIWTFSIIILKCTSLDNHVYQNFNLLNFYIFSKLISFNICNRPTNWERLLKFFRVLIWNSEEVNNQYWVWQIVNNKASIWTQFWPTLKCMLDPVLPLVFRIKQCFMHRCF